MSQVLWERGGSFAAGAWSLTSKVQSQEQTFIRGWPRHFGRGDCPNRAVRTARHKGDMNANPASTDGGTTGEKQKVESRKQKSESTQMRTALKRLLPGLRICVHLCSFVVFLCMNTV